MTVSRPALVAFNRGIISPRALARTDLKRTELSAEAQKNWMPRTLGSMMLRPGLGFIGTANSNLKAVFLPFIRASDDTALLEFTHDIMRVWIVDNVARTAALVTRVAVTTTLTNGTFATGDLTGWTDASETGASTAWASGGPLGRAAFQGTGQNRAILYQTLTVAGANIGKRHAIRILVNRGPLTLRIGSGVGKDDYQQETVLGAGTHSIAFTPAGNATIWFAADAAYKVLLDNCTLEGAGAMTLPTPYDGTDVELIRWGQSVDVVYLAAQSTSPQTHYQQRKIEHRAADSWSIVLYQPLDGPFRVENTTPTTIAASAIKGDITLTASRDTFYPGHIGALWRIRSVGQLVDNVVAGADQWSDPIEVAGIGQSRNITVLTTGTWVGTLRIQRSVGAVGDWDDVTTGGWSSAANFASVVLNDTFDNDLIFYRIGFKTGEYTSGSADVSLAVKAGGINGITRITGFTDTKHLSATVLKTLGGTLASDTWWEGLWSDFRGWPSAVTEPYEGRLCWAGIDFEVQSVSDAYESFDDTIEGDSGPIIRSIGVGPVANVNWLLGLQRLLMGGDLYEYSIRSSSLDEPLTPSNWNLKATATVGSARVPAARWDSDAFFVDKSTTRLFRLSFNPSYFSGVDYSSADVTKIAEQLGAAGFVRVAIQRMPDTRIHCVRGDGTAAILVFDPLEDVQCWVEFETDGIVEDVVILPGLQEDMVFYSILREAGTYVAVHSLELWAMESECRGPYSTDAALNKQADCFIVFEVGGGGPTTAITGIPAFLNGNEVVLWADGKDMGGAGRNTFTVVAGGITAPVAVSKAVVGLYYEASYKSTKLAYGGENQGTALGARKEVKDLAIITGVMHSQGLRYGRDFNDLTSLDDMPGITSGGNDAGDGAAIPFDFVWQAHDKDPVEFPGEMTVDSRVCLLAQAPRPCELLGLVPGIVTSDAPAA